MHEHGAGTPDGHETHDFDAAYWERHWQDRPAGGPPPNPYLARELGDLAPGTALDAGCGAGAEAVWLAEHGWQVTAVDVSAEALARAADRPVAADAAGRVRWQQADLCDWRPATAFDLVTTHYAHPAMPQLDFYERIADWVAPGGTLLVVGHGSAHHHGDGPRHGDGPQPPAEATVTAADVTGRLDDAGWEVLTAGEQERSVTAPDGRVVALRDVVVRAVRRR